MGFFDNKMVTVFNRSYNPETEEEKYFLTLLKGVDLVETRGANVEKSGTDSADSAKLYLDYSSLPKSYIEPKAWDALSEEEKRNFITFHLSLDFFALGDCTGVELPESYAYEWARENLDNVYKVTNVDKYEDILPHFEVGGV